MTLDAELIDQFIQSTVHVLKVQCGINPCANPENPTSLPSYPQVDIKGIIEIAEPTQQCLMALCFSEEVYIEILSRMLGESFPSITQELEDGVAELTNMIFGAAKTILNEKGYMLPLAIPKVLRRKASLNGQPPFRPATTILFTSEIGDFTLEFSEKSNDKI